MKILLLTQALLRAPLLCLRHWLRHALVSAHNSDSLISFPVVFQYDDLRAIHLGKCVVIGPFSEIVVYSKSKFSDVSGKFSVEDHAVIGSHANIRAAGGEIRVGKNVLIGQHVSLVASSHQISSSQARKYVVWDSVKTGIFIDENVWIGANVTILPGCSIGRNSVVGAGSIVTKSIPSNELWVGVPARKVRDLHQFGEIDTTELGCNQSVLSS